MPAWEFFSLIIPMAVNYPVQKFANLSMIVFASIRANNQVFKSINFWNITKVNHNWLSNFIRKWYILQSMHFFFFFFFFFFFLASSIRRKRRNRPGPLLCYLSLFLTLFSGFSVWFYIFNYIVPVECLIYFSKFFSNTARLFSLYIST